MKLEFTIDLKDCANSKQVMLKFKEIFKLPDTFQGNNWDAFYDWFTSLDSDSKIIRESPERVTEVHLLIKNIISFQNNDKEGFEVFAYCMFRATDATYPDSRYDRIYFSFTVQNDHDEASLHWEYGE